MKLRALGLVWGQDLYGPLLHWTPYAVKWIAYESEPYVFVASPASHWTPESMRHPPTHPWKLSELRALLFSLRALLFSRGKGSR